mmetsp:Transcript_33481/g.70379  ORF Transcript_33481/g.70379 Transcript_33481/m.70379 type:complete len:277 (+) Transcript_33481:618-1448(+)
MTHASGGIAHRLLHHQFELVPSLLLAHSSDEHALLQSLALRITILLHGLAHHESPLDQSMPFLLERQSSLHVLHTAQPPAAVEHHPKGGGPRCKMLAPLGRHVKLNLGPLHGVWNGVDKITFQSAQFHCAPHRSKTGAVWHAPGFGVKILGAQLGVLHLLRQSTLLGFQHGGQKIVQLQSVLQWQIPRQKVGDQGVAERNLLIGPPPGSRLGGIVALHRPSGRRATVGGDHGGEGSRLQVLVGAFVADRPANPQAQVLEGRPRSVLDAIHLGKAQW